MTPEGRVKQSVKELLNIFKKVTSGGLHYHMAVQNGMGEPTLDFTGCFFGRYFAIETKAPGKKPTPRQRNTIKQMERAGAVVFVVSDSKSLSALATWLKHVKGCKT